MTTLGRVAVDFSYTIAIIIASPLVLGMADYEVVRPALVASQFVAVEDAAGQQQAAEDGLTGFLVTAVADPHPLLAALARGLLEERRAIIGERSPAWPLISSSPWLV